MRHMGGLPRSRRPLGLLGIQFEGRWAVLLLTGDLTAALLGNSNVEPVGLTPESADRFITALLKWKLDAQR
jgi:hypothetical protein